MRKVMPCRRSIFCNPGAWLQQVASRTLVGMLGKLLTVAVAEDVLEEQVRVATLGLEQQHVRARETLLVAFHAGLHARLDQRAEGLAQHAGQATVRQVVLLRWIAVRGARCTGRIEGDQRVHAHHEVRARLQQHRSIHGPEQRAVGVDVAVDRDRRVQARQGGAGLDGARDRDVVETRLAEAHGMPGVEVGRDDVEAWHEPAEIIGSSRAGKELAQQAFERTVVADSGGQQAADRVDGLGPVLARVAQVFAGDVREHAGDARQALRILAKRRQQEPRWRELELARLVVDEHEPHVGRVEAIGQPGHDHGAGADADVHLEFGEFVAVEGFVDGVQAADLVKSTERPAARQGEAETTRTADGSSRCRLQV